MSHNGIRSHSHRSQHKVSDKTNDYDSPLRDSSERTSRQSVSYLQLQPVTRKINEITVGKSCASLSLLYFSLVFYRAPIAKRMSDEEFSLQVVRELSQSLLFWPSIKMIKPGVPLGKGLASFIKLVKRPRVISLFNQVIVFISPNVRATCFFTIKLEQRKILDGR